MAEPILGEGLALQSNWQPDTSKVITAGTGKLLDIDLRKQIAKQKAEEAKAKEEMLIASKFTLKTPKISIHNVDRAKDIATKSTADAIRMARMGDLVGAQNSINQGQAELNAIEVADKQLQQFVTSKGNLLPEKLIAGLQMRKSDAKPYLDKVLTENPEYAEIFNEDEFGNYRFNPVKDLDLTQNYADVIANNASQFAQISQKNVGGRRIQEYKIMPERIGALATEMAMDRNYVVNALFKDKQGVNAEINRIGKLNPSLTTEQVREEGLKSYFRNKLESANQDFSSTAIPKASTGGAGSKPKIGAIDFAPTVLNNTQVASIAEIAGAPKTNTHKSVVMPNITDVFSFTDAKGRLFNAPINNVTDYDGKLYISGAAKNIAAEGVNVPMTIGMDSAAEFTPSAWKAIKVYYAPKKISGEQLAKFINDNLAAAGSNLMIDAATGNVRRRGVKPKAKNKRGI